MAHRAKFTPKRKEEFLEVLSRTANVTISAECAGISRRTAYDHRDKDEAFEKAWDEAVECATDQLLEEARRRAALGVTEPVYYQGKIVGGVRRYSDNLLMFLIKARRPEYRDRSRFEVTGKDGGPLELNWASLVQEAHDETAPQQNGHPRGLQEGAV